MGSVVTNPGGANATPGVIITGASSGIGEAFAHYMADKCEQLVLVARRRERLEKLADDIADYGVKRPFVLAYDLTKSDATAWIAHELASYRIDPAMLINNAGFGLLGPADEMDRAQQTQMIDLNVRTLTDLSLRFVDALARNKGGIINVGSIAGFMPGPGMSVYYASKAFVVSFSQALAVELAPRGVHVSVLCPGPVMTEFQTAAGMRHMSFPDFLIKTPEEVVEAAYEGYLSRKRVIIPGIGNQMLVFLSRIMPRKLFAEIIGNLQATRRGYIPKEK